ncbi:GGDEF domain-containing protein [Dactylosporangium sp. CA-139066]|uniref:GGDEF domain-containing protein n=1 Tax=Dactylosporangium sp. CA-139066 TaxID=3239930 RepID=UPI003D90EED1
MEEILVPIKLDNPAQRHPTAVRHRLAFVTLVLTSATIPAALTGHTVLTVIGILALGLAYVSGCATVARRYEQRLAHAVAEARNDPLTGLPNRALADEMLEAAGRGGAAITVALIDVNGLHTINGNLGHAAGDQYLTLIARRLAQAVPPHGVLVRQGGDEFTLLAWNTDPQDLADQIGAALAGPAVIAGYRIQPRASVGIAATDTAADGTVDAQHARARADAAMYTAKRDGGNQIRIFDPDRDPEPSPDGTRPLVRRRDINPIAEAGMAWLPTPGDELIPLLLAPAELRTVAHALATAAEGWSRAGAEATANASRPASAPSSEPGWMNIEPTPAGYSGIARLAAQQQARYTGLLQRLQPIIATVDALDEAGHTTPSPSVMAPGLSCVVLVGISAAFPPEDLDALVITAAEAVHGDPGDLSGRQLELAARAYDLLHATDQP